jgi:hypothetical protein
MQSLPVVIIRCEENEINQLDFRIQTDNIRCFILLSGLRKLNSIVQINRTDHLFICIFLKRIIKIYCRNEFREFSFKVKTKFSYFSIVVPVDENPLYSALDC